MAAKPTRARPRKSPEQSIDFEPVFTQEQVEKIEADYNQKWGVSRRLMMIVLARSGASLVERWTRGKGEAFVAMFEAIANYRTHLSAGVDLADSALARLRSIAAYVDKIVTPKERR